MRQERIAAAATLKKQIKATKAAANASLLEASNLLSEMARASLETGLFAIGQPAVEKALALATAATSLRGLAGEAHLLLAEARTLAGLDLIALGDDDDSPKPDRARSELRAVA